MPILPLSLTIAVSMAIALLMGGPFIAYLKRWKIGQSIREEGPQSHHAKAGTPTMGGWIIVAPALVATLAIEAAQRAVTADLLAVMGVVLAYAGIGWLDDYLIIKRKKNKGLSARQKFLAQIAVSVLFALYLWKTGHGTTVFVPVTHDLWDLGWLYYPLLVLVMTAATNAVNLTDGLDGLASGTTAIALAGLAWMIH